MEGEGNSLLEEYFQSLITGEQIHFYINYVTNKNKSDKQNTNTNCIVTELKQT